MGAVFVGEIWFVGWIAAIVGFRIAAQARPRRQIVFTAAAALVGVLVSGAFAASIARTVTC